MYDYIVLTHKLNNNFQLNLDLYKLVTCILFKYKTNVKKLRDVLIKTINSYLMKNYDYYYNIIIILV